MAARGSNKCTAAANEEPVAAEAVGKATAGEEAEMADEAEQAEGGEEAEAAEAMGAETDEADEEEGEEADEVDEADEEADQIAKANLDSAMAVGRDEQGIECSEHSSIDVTKYSQIGKYENYTDEIETWRVRTSVVEQGIPYLAANNDYSIYIDTYAAAEDAVMNNREQRVYHRAKTHVMLYAHTGEMPAASASAGLLRSCVELASTWWMNELVAKLEERLVAIPPTPSTIGADLAWGKAKRAKCPNYYASREAYFAGHMREVVEADPSCLSRVPSRALRKGLRAMGWAV